MNKPISYSATTTKHPRIDGVKTKLMRVIPDERGYLQEILRARAPRNLRTACLLSKPSRRKVDVKVEYIGFTIEDRFAVGYGLDYAERYRSLPHIAVIGDQAR